MRISRVRHVFALPTLGYSERLPPIVTGPRTLFAQLVTHRERNTKRQRNDQAGERFRGRSEGSALPVSAASGRTWRQSSETRPLFERPKSLPVCTPFPINQTPIIHVKAFRQSVTGPLQQMVLHESHAHAGGTAIPWYLDLVVPRFLKVLHDRQLKMTVFVVGQDAVREENFEALASISAACDEIGNHSFNHEPWSVLSASNRN